MGTTPPTIYTDQFETLQALLSWSVDVHVVLALSFLSFFIHPFEKRDVLCYGIWCPSIRP